MDSKFTKNDQIKYSDRFSFERKTSGRTNAYVIIVVIRIPIVHVRTIRIDIADVHHITIGRQSVVAKLHQYQRKRILQLQIAVAV